MDHADDPIDLMSVLCARCEIPIDVDGDESPPYYCDACAAPAAGDADRWVG